MIVVLDYGMGNLGSFLNLYGKLKIPAKVSSDPGEIEQAQKLILPGVGYFAYGMQKLKESGLEPLITKKVMEDKTPIMGICLGMQLMTEHSEEGDAPGLGWVKGQTIRIPKELDLRVPHVGFNKVEQVGQHPIWDGVDPGSYFYFTHTYHVVPTCSDVAIGRCEYGQQMVCSFAQDNIVATQFHPEKSHNQGIQLMRNFAEWNYAKN